MALKFEYMFNIYQECVEVLFEFQVASQTFEQGESWLRQKNSPSTFTERF